ncbi:adenosine deaminase [Ophiostoma piceae UAMH 11346]|uniref:Adenosine deaminase n=1 Tax=Ophiostoma piceae (strain UAMH 11346) TaxID=1262450 RepID=S3BTA4_OPHP1|nr:adenosine deaminase [Ophiostoma piceae UAMH 11346]
MNGLEISPFITDLPKVELHIHIEGTLSPSLRWKLAHRNNVPLAYATYEELLASYAVTYNHRPEMNGDKSRPTFFEAYFAGCQVLCQEQDFYEMAMEYYTRCQQLNIRHCEVFFDIQTYTRRGVPAEYALNGYMRAQREAAATLGVTSYWILCFLRHLPAEEGMADYETARPWACLADGTGHNLFRGVGLAANEYKRPPLLFEEAFQRAVADGLKVTMHCDVDQLDHHEHIHEAIFKVCGGRGADRIDHGLDAYSRPDLVAGLKERNIGLTLCPHAYHRRQPTEVLFPKIQFLWDSGVKFCLNSDDPTYMHNVWIDGAMQKAYTYCTFSKRDMRQLAINGVEMSWADNDVKKAILAELAAVNVEET